MCVKHTIRCLPLSFFVLLLMTGVTSGQDDVSIRFEGDRVSATVRKASLSSVLNTIREERGIWLETGFLKNESLLDEQISVTFEDIAVKDGLERILSGINHCLIFEQGSIAGIMLFGKTSNTGNRQRRPVTRQRRPLRRSPSR